MFAPAWKGTSTSKIYSELGWESLSQRRWLRRMSLLFKILNNGTPSYLKRCITFPDPPWFTCYGRDVSNLVDRTRLVLYPCRTDKFSLSFSHLVFILGTTLLTEINAPLKILVFSRKVLHLYLNLGKNLFGLSDNQDIRRVTQLGVDLNTLRFYKFSPNILDTNNPMCLIHDGMKIVNTTYSTVAFTRYLEPPF